MKRSMRMPLLAIVVLSGALQPASALGTRSYHLSYADTTEQTVAGSDNVVYHYYQFFDRRGAHLGIVVYAQDARTRGLATSDDRPLFRVRNGRLALSCFESSPTNTTFLMTNNPTHPKLAAYDRCRLEAKPAE